MTHTGILLRDERKVEKIAKNLKTENVLMCCLAEAGAHLRGR
jgi:hypothetical protein